MAPVNETCDTCPLSQQQGVRGSLEIAWSQEALGRALFSRLHVRPHLVDVSDDHSENSGRRLKKQHSISRILYSVDDTSTVLSLLSHAIHHEKLESSSDLPHLMEFIRLSIV